MEKITIESFEMHHFDDIIMMVDTHHGKDIFLSEDIFNKVASTLFSDSQVLTTVDSLPPSAPKSFNFGDDRLFILAPKFPPLSFYSQRVTAGPVNINDLHQLPLIFKENNDRLLSLSPYPCFLIDDGRLMKIENETITSLM